MEHLHSHLDKVLEKGPGDDNGEILMQLPQSDLSLFLKVDIITVFNGVLWYLFCSDMWEELVDL